MYHSFSASLRLSSRQRSNVKVTSPAVLGGGLAHRTPVPAELAENHEEDERARREQQHALNRVGDNHRPKTADDDVDAAGHRDDRDEAPERHAGEEQLERDRASLAARPMEMPMPMTTAMQRPAVT
jgi:hypothetical protein